MNLKKFISSLFLSLIFVATPLFGITTEMDSHKENQQEDCCALTCEMDSEQSNTAEIQQDCKHEGNHNDCGDDCKNKCTDHASHVVSQTIKSPEQNSKKIISFHFLNEKQTIFYQDLTLQIFVLQFWNPPKSA